MSVSAVSRVLPWLSLTADLLLSTHCKNKTSIEAEIQYGSCFPQKRLRETKSIDNQREEGLRGKHYRETQKCGPR